MLHSHPNDLDLEPEEYVELLALKELEHRDVCRSCQFAALERRLRKTCDVCGREYKDRDIARQIDEWWE